ERAYKVSYNRPLQTRGTTPEDSPFSAEYPMVRWLERNGYDVSYFTGVDADRRGSEILEHKVYLSVGHDEYWSGQQRANVEAAREAGVNLAFFSGNEVFWKTRWENSIDGSNTDHRTLVCYKETHANAKIDPKSTVWTGTWRDPRFSPPADGGRPENALSGQMFMVNSGTSSIEVPAEYSKMRLWRNTSVASLAPGETASLGTETLGYEWDEDILNSSRPPGLIDLSSTTFEVPDHLVDYGSNYLPGMATHHLTLYRAPSGALVFGAGTVQWSWGLDTEHDRGAFPREADPNMQQATANLLADMGAQAETLEEGLVAPSQSTDVTPPVTTITSPAEGAHLESGTPITVTGASSDAKGQVAAVEVSIDGGASWHPAEGRGTWKYKWTPGKAGAASVMARATDDSANLEKPGDENKVEITARTCPCSIWDSSVTAPGESDPSEIELGVKFRADAPGLITGLRYYKPPGSTGTHIGRLWTANGVQLAEAAFTNETASGWQQVNLASPVPISADTTYVASYFAPNGNYAAINDYFALVGADSSPLHALADGVDGPNGVFSYG
ncbi:MAG: N,N-dimethylformamidase beta subunit family domain-containing protein, partial [Thermoleophilia bacterium]